MRSFIVAGRVIRQIVKDRRTLALLLIAPVLVLFLLYSVLNNGAFTPNVQAVALPQALQAALTETSDVTESADLEAALTLLRNRETDAVIVWADPTVTVYVEGTKADVTASVKKAVASAVSTYAAAHAQEEVSAQFSKYAVQASGGEGTAASPEISLAQTQVDYAYLNGSESTTSFEDIAPMLMGFFIFFFVFLLAGVSFLRERNSGTLERLLATPVRRYEIVLGYFIGFGVFVFLQTLLIQAYMTGVLGVMFKGDFALVMLVNLLLAFASLALGTLLSAFARNELQMFQFIPLVVVPQVLFCGLFGLRNAPVWVTWLSKAFLLTYAADALSGVALRGFGFSVVWPDLLVLTAFTLAFLTLNTLALKKYRRI
jgi:ABC-2 type transport system permease protein